MRLLLTWLSLLSLSSWTRGYEVLVVFTMPPRSHDQLGKGVVEALLNAGHKVTWATPYPPTKPVDNLTVIDCSVVLSKTSGDLSRIQNLNIVTRLAQFKQSIRTYSTITLTPVLRKTLVEKQFDAVVTEYLYNDFESGYAAIQQVPWIALFGTVIEPSLQAVMDEARTVPTLPVMFADFPVPMNFWQRLINTAAYLGMNVIERFDEPINKLQYEAMFSNLAKARGVTLSPYKEARKNISILFVNTHPAMAPPIAFAPNMIEVGGFHMGEVVPLLPEDLQQLLDNSPQGAVYFSMGTVLRSSSFSNATRKRLLEVFAKLPHTVLWKLEEPLSDLPSNVHVRNWMPQRSILAHKHVRAFVTHGGMLGSLEAASHGVPLVSIPVFGDQPANAARAERNGYGRTVKLDMDTLASDLEEALRGVLFNDNYYKRAQEAAAVFNKQLVPPSRIVSHYIELAIETKGAYHLRSKSQLYPWYARAMSDQVAFLLVVVIILCYIIKKTVGFIINKIFVVKISIEKNNKVD